MRPNGTLFLMYHEIESAGRPLGDNDPGYVRYVVTEQKFTRQLESIRAAGLQGTTIGAALDNLRTGARPCIGLTFDDGSETDWLVAAPLLRSRGFNATFFIVAGLIGTPRFLSTNQLRELHGAGFEIGSHSMTHRHLSDLDEEDLHEELRASKDRLEQVISGPIVHLSCPNGRWSPRVARVAKEVGYRTISTSRIDRNYADTNPSNLARLAVMRDLDVEEFSDILRGASLVRHRRRAKVLGLAKRALGNAFYDKIRSVLLREE